MKVELTRCENDIDYATDIFGDIIGFYEDYKDSEGNIYKVYYKSLVDDYYFSFCLSEDLLEYVADWGNPTDIEYYVDEEDGAIAKAITKKANGKCIGYGDSLLDIGCSVETSKRGHQLILDI